MPDASLSTSELGTIGSLISEMLSTLLPAEISSERFNSEYMQRHPKSAKAVISCAKGLHILAHPQEEVEDVVFSVLNPEVDINIQVRIPGWVSFLRHAYNTIIHKTALAALSYLKELKSPRADEFRLACDEKFELSTVFKTQSELVSAHETTEPTDEDVELA